MGKHLFTRMTVATVVAGVGFALPAHAQANYTVDPVQMKLAAGATNTTVTITNQGAAELRLELEIFTWDHDETGEMDLQPTQDLILFPPLVTLQPGERQQVRVGIETPFDATEKAYRLLVQEIPSQATEAGQVTLRTVVSVPIFLQPADETTEVRVDAGVDGRTVHAMVHNLGNVHVQVDAVMFRGLDGDGLVVFEDSTPGWYVLAARNHIFDLEVTDAMCSAATAIEIDAAMHGELVSHVVDAATVCR